MSEKSLIIHNVSEDFSGLEAVQSALKEAEKASDSVLLRHGGMFMCVSPLEPVESFKKQYNDLLDAREEAAQYFLHYHRFTYCKLKPLERNGDLNFAVKLANAINETVIFRTRDQNSKDPSNVILGVVKPGDFVLDVEIHKFVQKGKGKSDLSFAGRFSQWALSGEIQQRQGTIH